MLRPDNVLKIAALNRNRSGLKKNVGIAASISQSEPPEVADVRRPFLNRL
jgi:hypothetical protein